MTVGEELDETCNRDGCTGKIIEGYDPRSCCCFSCPPCSKCVDPVVECNECGWTNYVDYEEW